jgi:hypothetical protein
MFIDSELHLLGIFLYDFVSIERLQLKSSFEAKISCPLFESEQLGVDIPHPYV